MGDVKGDTMHAEKMFRRADKLRQIARLGQLLDADLIEALKAAATLYQARAELMRDRKAF